MNEGVAGRTVLVTGGAGFVGSHIAERLVDDNDVLVMDDCSTGDRSSVPGGATLIESDLRETDALADATEGVDLIFHQAAWSSVARSVERPAESHDVNATGTLALLDRAREIDARVVLASSAAIYGQPDALPVVESEPKEPESPYGVQKLAADRYAAVYADVYGVETVALRYFNVYGPGANGGVVEAFRRRLADGEPIEIHGDGEQTRDFVHVDDVVRANLLAATTDRVGEAYNVGTGDSVSIRELAERMCDLADADAEIIHREARDGDVDHSRASIEKARTELGYEPSVGLGEGLRTVVE